MRTYSVVVASFNERHVIAILHFVKILYFKQKCSIALTCLSLETTTTMLVVLVKWSPTRSRLGVQIMALLSSGSSRPVTRPHLLKYLRQRHIAIIIKSPCSQLLGCSLCIRTQFALLSCIIGHITYGLYVCHRQITLDGYSEGYYGHSVYISEAVDHAVWQNSMRRVCLLQSRNSWIIYIILRCPTE